MATIKQEMEFFHEVNLLCPLPTIVAWTSLDAKEIHILALGGEDGAHHELMEIKLWAVIKDGLLPEWHITPGDKIESAVLWRDINSVVGRVTRKLASCWLDDIYRQGRLQVINDAEYGLQDRFLALKSKLVAGIVQGTMQQYEKLHVEKWLAELNKRFYADHGRGFLSGELIRMCTADAYVRKDLLSCRWARDLARFAVSNATTSIQLRDNLWFTDEVDAVLVSTNAVTQFLESYKELRKQLFSSRALRRSLPQMPERLPNQTIENMLKLQQAGLDFRSPLPNDRVIWILVSMLATALNGDDPFAPMPTREGNSTAFAQAVYDVIRRTSLKRLKQLIRHECPSGLRKSYEIMMVMRSLLDIPKDTVFQPDMQLAGLSELSKRIHREEQARDMKYDPNTATVQPPIPLPDDQRITFLSTCQEMYDEGAEMNHCVGWGHAENAIRGHAYYFHFEDAEGKATVMVSSTTGKVEQAFGPRNRITTASRQASRLLAAWGKNLKGLPRPIPVFAPPAKPYYGEVQEAIELEEFAF